MDKVKDFFKWFNRPSQIFEIFGYIVVGIGVLITVVGVIAMFLNTGHSSGASTGGIGFINPLFGLIIAIVAPQLFFAIAKVVKAAEKYLGE